MAKDKAGAGGAAAEMKVSKYLKDGLVEYHSPTLHVSQNSPCFGQLCHSGGR